MVPFAQGRDADVFELDETRVLRRYRDGGDASPEAEVMRIVGAQGYPVPQVYEANGTDLVMERLDGSTLADAMLGGALPIEQGATILADLHDRLHQTGYIHLDLHPYNVMLTSRGPVVIDWRNARKGSGDLDIADTALVLGMVALDEAHPVAPAAQVMLEVFLRTVTGDPATAADEALTRRRSDPNLSEAELARMEIVASTLGKTATVSDVSIRETREEDIETLFEFQLEPEGAEMAAFPSRDREAYFTHRHKIMADPTVITRTIVAGDEVAGDIGCWEQEGEHLVGYWVGKAFWGKGIATAALKLLTSEAQARPLRAFVAVHNVGSIRVLEKCGFRRVPGSSHLGDDGIEEITLELP